MRKFYLLLCLIVLSGPLYAAENSLPQTSLFFTPEQTRQAESKARQNAPAGSADIHLGAVFSYGPDDWTLWLQGEKWTPQTRRDDLRVDSVSAEHVRIVWRDENDAEHMITLQPNQSYQMATGSIRP